MEGRASFYIPDIRDTTFLVPLKDFRIAHVQIVSKVSLGQRWAFVLQPQVEPGSGEDTTHGGETAQYNLRQHCINVNTVVLYSTVGVKGIWLLKVLSPLRSGSNLAFIYPQATLREMQPNGATKPQATAFLLFSAKTCSHFVTMSSTDKAMLRHSCRPTAESLVFDRCHPHSPVLRMTVRMYFTSNSQAPVIHYR